MTTLREAALEIVADHDERVMAWPAQETQPARLKAFDALRAALAAEEERERAIAGLVEALVDAASRLSAVLSCAGDPSWSRVKAIREKLTHDIEAARKAGLVQP